MLGVGRGLGGAPVMLGFDTQASLPGTTVLGAPLHLALSPSFQALPLGLLAGVGPGNGFTSFAVAVPDEPAAAGIELVLQWFVFDGSAPGGLAASRGLRLEFFAATEL